MTTVGLRVDDTSEMTSTSVPAGFTALYEQHAATVYRAALRVTGNAADAEDVLQTVFLRLLSRTELAGAARHPTAYFRRAAVNAAVDLLRRRAAHPETVLEDGGGPATEPTLLLKERLRRAIATLPSEDGSLFLLRYVEGLSNGELADLFGIQRNNVAVRLHRIRLRLQAEMER